MTVRELIRELSGCDPDAEVDVNLGPDWTYLTYPRAVVPYDDGRPRVLLASCPYLDDGVWDQPDHPYGVLRDAWTDPESDSPGKCLFPGEALFREPLEALAEVLEERVAAGELEAAWRVGADGKRERVYREPKPHDAEGEAKS